MPHETQTGNGVFGGDLLLFESLESTNSWAMAHARELHHGDVVQALSQTSGRGRFTREWFTPPATCLTMSLVLAIEEDDPLLPFITIISALAIADTVRAYDLEPMLKWPNDVLVNDRKVAGILAEKGPAEGKLVLGMGLNVNLEQSHLDAMDLRQPATSLLIETSRSCRIDEIRQSLLRHFESIFSDAREKGEGSIIQSWSRSDALSGKQITIESPDSSIQGIYDGIDGEGRLLLRDNEGAQHSFWSGDVSVVVDD